MSPPPGHLEESGAVRPAAPASAHTPRRARRPGRAHRAAGRPRHPERRRPGARRPGQRVMTPGAERMCAGRTTEPAAEVKRQDPLHAAPQLPAREPAAEARLARHLQPFLHLLDHVHRRRPPESRQQRPRQRVPVLDRPRCLVVTQTAARDVRQLQFERLLALVVRVVEHRDHDRLRRVAGREGQRPARRHVIGAGRRSAVLGRVLHR